MFNPRSVIPCALVALLATAAQAAPRWSRLAIEGTPARAAQSLVFVDDAQPPFAVGFGGCDEGTCFGADPRELSGSTDLFANGWQHISAFDAPTSRFGAAFGAAGDGGALLFSGEGTRMSGDTWRFDGAAWTKLAPPASPPARGFAASASDPENHLFVVFGGENEAGEELDDLWLYTRGNWIAATVTGPSPSPRAASAMASLGGGRFLLFGGHETVPSADTWILACRTDAVGACTWEERTPAAHEPPPRWGHALAFDPVRGVALLFGGAAPGGSGTTNVFADVWEWRESGWTERTDAPAPPPRFRSALAWDGAHRRLVLWGGEAGMNEPPTDDLWAFGEPDETPDAGTSPDGGGGTADAGSPGNDGGFAVPDGGTSAPDGGSADPDGGSPGDAPRGRYGCHAATPAGLGLLALARLRRRRSR